jgi:RHS repeat-associated protein
VALPTGSTTQYNANNQVSASSLMGGAGLGYDPSGAGYVTLDNQNRYLYDGEGRICATQSLYTGTIIGYIYDAEGTRVAKGTLSGFDCGSTFTETNWYVLGLSGEQLTEESNEATGGTGPLKWAHTNVYATGELIATYDIAGLHFQLNDWLGTRRVETDYAGNVQENCASLPFGDGATNCVGPTEQFFTGKERDTESGLDYFGARYYGSTGGRFMTPDPGWMFATKISNPQSLNLYAYVQNLPLTSVDPNGYESFSSACMNEIADGNRNFDGPGCAGFFSNKRTSSPHSSELVDSEANYLTSPGGPGYQVSGGHFFWEWYRGDDSPSSANNLNEILTRIDEGPIDSMNGGGGSVPRICGGTFSFAGVEGDAAEGGMFAGAIHEHDSVDGNSTGSLVEAWGGGEVGLLGAGKITSPNDKSLFQGGLGFLGAGINAGPLAGVQIGSAGGRGWGGLYAEGHFGHLAWGVGGYLRGSCKAGGS